MMRTPKYLLVLAPFIASLGHVQDGHAQTTTPAVTGRDSASHPSHYWRNLAAGFMSSIFLHETGHVVTAYAVGGHPHLGFDKGRPTIYSGIDGTLDPHKQFLFSSAGLNVQAVLDEGILDIPHHRGAAFERGLLAGGIATAYFYATLGRNASNSDITFMAKTSSLSKTQASLIYAGLATIHMFRIAHNGHYAHFFMRPGDVPVRESRSSSGSSGGSSSRSAKSPAQALHQALHVGVAILPI